MLVKPHFALLGLLWLRPVEWRHLGTATATVLPLFLGSLAVVGSDAWMNYLEYVRGFPC